MNYPLYVHWIPTHLKLSNRSLYTIRRLLNNYSTTTSYDYKFEDNVEKGEYIKKIVSYKGEDLFVAVFRSGLFVIKGMTKYQPNILSFVGKAESLYAEVRDSTHSHMFNHRLSKHFPLAWVFPDKMSWKDLRPEIIKQMKENYLNDLVEEQRSTSLKRDLVLKDILGVADDILQPEGFFLLYPYINLLSECRVKSALIYEKIESCCGVQSFMTSFIELTESTTTQEERDKRQKTMSFFKDGHRIASELTKEFSEVVGSYTLQVLLLILTVALVAIPFIILLLEKIIFTEFSLLTFSIVTSLAIVFIYFLGYRATRRIAKQISSFIIQYFNFSNKSNTNNF